MKRLPFIIIGGAIVAAVFLIANSRFQNENPTQDANGEASDLQKNFESQTNNDGAVTIAVLPQNISESGLWEFKVTLDTHSGALSEDVAAVSVLVDDAGKEYAPLMWEGDPPGGHHREGILRFDAIQPPPASFTLNIGGIGGVPKRSFLWQIR